MSQNYNGKVTKNGTSSNVFANPEVVGRAQRRQFSSSEKVRILQAADACTQPGELGALLRREGIYSSYLTEWRRERAAEQLPAPNPAPQGRAPDAQAAELAQLRRENAQLKAQVTQAELIIAAQKKLTQALEQRLLSSPATP